MEYRPTVQPLLVQPVRIHSSSGEIHPFRWTAADGPTALDRSSGPFPSSGHAVSADGSVVVGVDNNQAAIVYPSLHILGGMPRATQSFANDVSADGLIAVGLSLIGGERLEAVRWINGGPAQSLGFFPALYPVAQTPSPRTARSSWGKAACSTQRGACVNARPFGRWPRYARFAGRL